MTKKDMKDRGKDRERESTGNCLLRVHEIRRWTIVITAMRMTEGFRRKKGQTITRTVKPDL